MTAFLYWRLLLAGHLHTDLSRYHELWTAESMEVKSEKKTSVLAVPGVGISWYDSSRPQFGDSCILGNPLYWAQTGLGGKIHFIIRTNYSGDYTYQEKTEPVLANITPAFGYSDWLKMGLYHCAPLWGHLEQFSYHCRKLILSLGWVLISWGCNNELPHT